jgi:hypothetical protein
MGGAKLCGKTGIGLRWKLWWDGLGVLDGCVDGHAEVRRIVEGGAEAYVGSTKDKDGTERGR